MEKTRILVTEVDEVIAKIDQAYAHEKALIISKANNVIALFTNFDESYAENGSTTAKYLELLENGPYFYIDAATQKAKDELTDAGITSEAIVSLALERISEKGTHFFKAFKELESYLDLKPLKPLYPGMKFALSDIEVKDGLAAIKNEIDLEPLKDEKARTYIQTELGYDLVEQAKNLKATFNTINTILRNNRGYNINDLSNFADIVDFEFTRDHANAQTEVNYNGIYNLVQELERKAVPARL